MTRATKRAVKPKAKASKPKPRAKAAADGPAQVDALLAKLDHPLQAEVDALRKVIRAAGPGLGERWKWNAPSYHLDGVDFAAFNLWQKDFVQLVMLFPSGVVDDPSGLLEGEWKDRRTARFDDMADVRRKKPALARIVRAWVERAK